MSYRTNLKILIKIMNHFKTVSLKLFLYILSHAMILYNTK